MQSRFSRSGLLIRRGLLPIDNRLCISGLHRIDQDVTRLCLTQTLGMKTQLHPPRRLLRTKEAARYLGMSPGKLRHLTQGGELPIIQHDERAPWLYDLRDLDDHIEKSKHRLTDFS